MKTSNLFSIRIFLSFSILFYILILSVPGARGAEVSSLHDAAKSGNLEAVRFLIEKGADVNSKNELNDTPLFEAAKIGNLDIVKLFVENGAKIDFIDFTMGGYPTKSAMYPAIFRGNIEVVRYLLQNNASVNGIEFGEGRSYLQYAIDKGHDDIAKLLIDKGANIKSFHRSGKTAISFAAWNRNMEIFNYLLEKGDDINGNGGIPPIIIAAQSLDKEFIELLIEKGADVNIQHINEYYGYEGESVLMYVLHKQDLSFAQYLIKRGADVDAKNMDGETALMKAAEFNRPDVVRFLVENGADLNVKSAFGKTALKYARENKHHDVADILKTAGAKE